MNRRERRIRKPDASGEDPAEPVPRLTIGFAGKHLLASYHGCDYAALTDVERLAVAFRAGIKAAGATLLQEASQILPSNGLIAVLLLSESHASIHTYPDRRCCFVDLFTWSWRCRPERFESILVAYLRPTTTRRRLVTRSRANDATDREGT